jgi:uncharacterized membrane protein YhdT
MTNHQLQLTSIGIAGLWSVQASRDTTLDDFTAALVADANKNASLALGEGLYLLRAWPHQAYLLTATAGLPAAAIPFETLTTDIADAFCAFSLEGESAFGFIADYLSTDIHESDSGSHCLRCRLGHYTALLWWQDRRCLHLLIDRSLAQSFEDYIGHLLKRRSHGQPEFNIQPARVTE